MIEEEMITTGIDKFIRMVYERGRVDLNEASKELGVAPGTLEYWCYILESHGLVRIIYTLTAVWVEWIGS